MKRVVAFLLVIVLLGCAAAASAGWRQDRKNWAYILPDGSQARNRWVQDGAWYYFGADGWMVTGWQYIGGNWYHFDRTGAMETGWKQIKGAWYYLKPDGDMKTGWLWYYGAWYYLQSDGRMATGWRMIDKEYYYFKSSGAMATGWQSINGGWYYFSGEGAAATGWQKIDGTLYYFDDTCRMATGWTVIGDQWYFFTDSGALKSGWQRIGNAWYYIGTNGAPVMGWQTIDGQTYYFKEKGGMATGWTQIGEKWYCFTEEGAVMKGWKHIGAIWYYFEDEGAMATGWRTLDGKTYYFNDGGAMVTAWVKIGSNWYHFTDNGELQTGWRYITGAWYYLGTDGKMATGWLEQDGKKYYLTENGKMVTGEYTIGDITYIFDKDGVLQGEKKAENRVGIALPTSDLKRWKSDGSRMEAQLKAAGYAVELQYAANNTATQNAQIETMISNGCDVLIIGAVDNDAMATVLAKAKEKEITVIAYDRLIYDSDAVSYYVTYSARAAGTAQGNYIKSALKLDSEEGPFTMELTAGAASDSTAVQVFNGAMSVLKPYIESGKLVVKSGQTSFDKCATASWSTGTAQTRAAEIISGYYSDTKIDAWLCSNDTTALGVTNALAAGYSGTWPVVTGMDCDIPNVKNIIAWKQSMSVFKDTGALATAAAKMAGQVLKGETVTVNDSVNNGAKSVPTYLCSPVTVTAGNYRSVLIDSGYYTEEDLK